MSTTPRSLLLAFAVLVSMAAIAPHAAATNQTEALKEQAGGTTGHCPEMNLNRTSGGCIIHLEGEMKMRFHVFGIEAEEAACHAEFRVRLDEGGLGSVYHYESTKGLHAADCSASAPACNGSLPWFFSAEELNKAFPTTMLICLQPAESGSPCYDYVKGTIYETGASEDQTFQHLDAPIGPVDTHFRCEIDWTFMNVENDGTFMEVHLRP